MIKETWRSKRPLDQPKFICPFLADPVQAEPEQPPQVCGYDSSALFREDTLIRLQELYKQVAQHERNIQPFLPG